MKKKKILYSGKEDGSQLTRRTHLPISQPNTDTNSEDRLCFPPLLPNTGLILIPLSFLVGSGGNGRICTQEDCTNAVVVVVHSTRRWGFGQGHEAPTDDNVSYEGGG